MVSVSYEMKRLLGNTSLKVYSGDIGSIMIKENCYVGKTDSLDPGSACRFYRSLYRLRDHILECLNQNEDMKIEITVFYLCELSEGELVSRVKSNKRVNCHTKAGNTGYEEYLYVISWGTSRRKVNIDAYSHPYEGDFQFWNFEGVDIAADCCVQIARTDGTLRARAVAELNSINGGLTVDNVMTAFTALGIFE